MDEVDKIILPVAPGRGVVHDAGDGPGGPIQAIQYMIVRHPEHPGTVFMDRPGDVIAEAVGVVGLVFIMSEGAVLRIGPVQARAQAGTDPQDACVIDVCTVPVAGSTRSR